MAFSRTPEAQCAYADACKKHDVEISSLGLIELNNKPYASDPASEQCVIDCIDVMQKMGQDCPGPFLWQWGHSG